MILPPQFTAGGNFLFANLRLFRYIKQRESNSYLDKKPGRHQQKFMEKQFTLDDIIEDLTAVEPLLLNYEKKYKVRTPHFYKLYKEGKLEERWDFIDWAGLYEIKLDREKEYEELASEALQQLPLKAGLILQEA
jgi:hypothetical protein